MSSLNGFLRKWLWDPKWRTIYRQGNAKILGASVASFVFIYLIARAISQGRLWLHNLGGGLVEEHPTLGAWISSISADLTMPLGLKLLAYSAISAVIGKGIYEASCPPYIKQGDSLEQFHNSYPDSLSILADDFRTLWINLEPNLRQKIRKDVQASHLISFYFMQGPNQQREDIEVFDQNTIIRYDYAHPHQGAGKSVAPTGNLMNILRYKDFGTAIFEVLREYRDGCNWFSRFTCAVTYYLAILFAALAILYQAWWVLPTLIE